MLLLQGIPSTGIFELDQETFTFSLNGNRRVYLTNDDHEVKLNMNQSLFEAMMEAGSYFLHLKEFVDCMQSPDTGLDEKTAPVGKVLQAFSISVDDFLRYY